MHNTANKEPNFKMSKGHFSKDNIPVYANDQRST